MTSDAAAEFGSDDLLPRLEVIEAQPLAERAQAFAAVHDELAQLLDATHDATGARDIRPSS